jgi:hypothetical protein
MEIAGDLLNPDDKARLDAWRECRLDSFAGFHEDASLAPNGFRTAGDALYLGTDFYRRCFGKRGVPNCLPNS